MQYHPKLKKAMEQIKEILREHDIAAYVVLHTPGYSEYLNHISPSYSCAKHEGDNGVRFKAKAEDYNGSKEVRNQKIKDTVNMVGHFADATSRDALNYIQLTEELQKITGAIDLPGSNTSHNQQNN